MGRLGIIAGAGTLPKELIDACRRDQRDFFVLGIEKHADPAFLADAPHQYVRLGQTGTSIAILKKNNVDTVVMAGAVRRPTLSEMRPDWRTIQVFARLGSRALGDDALLRAVSAELESEGFRVVGVQDIEPALITPPKTLTAFTPLPDHMADIEYGIRVTKVLGQMDVGQAAVVQQGIVLGLEAVEGTDALLDRCRSVRRKGRGGVLVKSCKPQQDKRADLPTIGIRTVRKAYEAGLVGIAVEAGSTIILGRQDVVEAANRLGLFIHGYTA